MEKTIEQERKELADKIRDMVHAHCRKAALKADTNDISDDYRSAFLNEEYELLLIVQDY